MEEWQKSETIVLWLIIAVSFLSLLLVFIIFLSRMMFKKMLIRKTEEAKIKLAHQQHLTNAVIKTQEKERKRIAADLHDALISKLTIIQIKEQAKEENNETAALLSESIGIARGISHDLSPPLMEHTSLEELMEELLHPWKEVVEIVYQLDIREEIDHSNEFKIQFIRIVQEILTNISKHAQASQLQVHLRQTAQKLVFIIADNGVGFPEDLKRKGLGLQNIETRVQYLKGQYKMKSKMNRGTRNIFVFNPKSV